MANSISPTSMEQQKPSPLPKLSFMAVVAVSVRGIFFTGTPVKASSHTALALPRSCGGVAMYVVARWDEISPRLCRS